MAGQCWVKLEHGQMNNNKRRYTMKKLLITIAIVLLASPCFAWTLAWQPVTGVDGYAVYYKSLAATTYNSMDVGTITLQSLDSIGLIPGTRYEFYVRAYVGTPPSYGGDSDHIRWTFPSEPIVVEMPAEERVLNIRIER